MHIKRIRAIYDSLPHLECKRLCQASCHWGPWAKSEMAANPKLVKGVCPLLSDGGLCMIYEDRPFMCRVWGMTPQLACPYGCRPDRWLSKAEVAGMWKALQAVGPEEHRG